MFKGSVWNIPDRFSSSREEGGFLYPSLSKFSKKYEEELQKVAAGLHKKQGTKKQDKVLEKLGRLKEKYKKVAYLVLERKAPEAFIWLSLDEKIRNEDFLKTV